MGIDDIAGIAIRMELVIPAIVFGALYWVHREDSVQCTLSKLA